MTSRAMSSADVSAARVVPAGKSLAELFSLRDQVAVVTGGGGGIGRAVCGRLAEAGARVVSWDLPGCASAPGIESVPCDLSDAESIRAAFAQLDTRHAKVDLLVHCAGITRDAVLWKMAEDDWKSVLSVNLDAAYHLLRQGIPRLRTGGGGSVVLVSSINGERGKFGQANYAASKAGLIGLARTAARETGAFGIRVNVVAPGMIATEMTENLPEDARNRAIEESALGRLGEPDEVARAVLFLLTDASRHVTGQVLRVDGGQLIG